MIADNAREIRNVRRWIDCNVETNRGRYDKKTMATKMTSKEREVVHDSGVSVAIRTEVWQSAKKKGISPLEERRGAYRKTPRQDELSCAEACDLTMRDVDSETE